MGSWSPETEFNLGKKKRVVTDPEPAVKKGLG